MVMKIYWGFYLENGRRYGFNIREKSMADAIAFLEGSKPAAVWIESITEMRQ
jgi:hypothetical protein